MMAERQDTGPFGVGDIILDKFEVRGLLGRGGHAFVYDCFNAFLAEEVAVKVIPHLVHRGNQLVKRARGEAQVLYRLNHPHVVRVMDGGEIDGMAYIVMEKLEGMTLRALMGRLGPLTAYEALTIALQIAEALEAAHAMNVIHRDLKPDNIFLLAENHVKVLDFGIAKFLEGGYQTTQRDLIQGTAPYMSPEQAQGHGVTFASDIFQLGVIMYEMIAGICPCMVGVEEPPSPQIIVAMQISKLPPRLKSIVPAVPNHVDRLIWRALAKEARQRFPVMHEFTVAIRTAIERMRAELPPSALAIRAVEGKRTRSHAPRYDSRSPPPKTTPVALVTGNPTRTANVRRAAALPSDSGASGGLGAQESTTDPRSARRLFIGAVAIGTLVALPLGVGIALFKRSHAHPRSAMPALSAGSKAQPAETGPSLEAAAPPPEARDDTAVASKPPMPAASAPLKSPTMPQPTATGSATMASNAKRPSSALKVAAKGATNPPALMPPSGLETTAVPPRPVVAAPVSPKPATATSVSPKRAAVGPVSPKPAAPNPATSVRPNPPKLIF
ncbi:MAG TPA: protein kinase [Polyangiaceae bacterium]|nr:protein kinase [Polyangiaceae bacterium]